MNGHIDPRLIMREAVQLERAGRLAEAEAAYMRLLSHWPDLPDSWYNLALVQRRLGRFDAALASYQQALDRGVSQPEEVHLNRGVIYSDCLRQDSAAERELQAALRLNPRYVPALLNLANLKEDLGEREAAVELYEQILALEPHCHEALARFAGLKGMESADDPLASRLRQAIASPDATAADRASLGFALGKALDGCGAYAEAFEAYAAANRASRSSAGAGAPLYDRAAHERFIDELLATFSRARSPSAAPASGVGPLFICGMFRSGSTLIEQVLAGHPGVTAGGELALLPSIVRTELAPFPASMARAQEQRVAALASNYLKSLERLYPGAALVTDKRPDNFLYIGLIKALFPNARIIYTRRNAIDNCLSIYFLHLDHSMSYALDLMDAAHYYAQHRKLMKHWESLYGADVFQVDYDAFVREPRPVVRSLLEFCGLEWDERCMSFERVRNAVKTASVWQVRQPLYQRSSGRWRNYEPQTAELRAYLRALGVVLEDARR